MKQISRLSSIVLIALLAIGSVMVFAPMSAKAAPTEIQVINVDTGDNTFYYTTKGVGDFIIMNITVVDVTALKNFQVKLTWDSSLLTYVSVTRPTPWVFTDLDPANSLIIPAPVVAPGSVTFGATYIMSNIWSFNGTGLLSQVKLQITQGVDELNPTVSCDLVLAGVGAQTFLIDSEDHDISFTTLDGHYSLTWVTPVTPTIYIKPAIEKPLAINDVFALEIWVKDISSAWSIIGFQFSLMWNTTFIAPEAPYYASGALLEGFDYPSGVLYVFDVNKHNRPLPLTPIPDDYNYSMFGALIMPDDPPNAPYHAPFVNGEGLLMTVYFKAVYETISPIEDWTWISFIDFTVEEDTYGLNTYLHLVPLITEDCHYRAPMKVLGLSIDVFTQYPFPYGGQGGNATSDSFGPQQLVDLFAIVTYNEYPVQQKLVGFQAFHQGATQTYNIYREDNTDENGMAHVSFRLPWPCADPVGEIFGWWYVNATVEVAEQTVIDNLKFWVWWPVEVVSVEPKFTQVVQSKQGCEMSFEMIYRRYDAQEIPVVLTATVYDELGFFIGSATLFTTVSNDPVTYDAFGNPIPHDYVWDFNILIPSNAVVGKCVIYGNAFNKLPWDGGTPYCPEVTNTIDFFIAKPP
jgi:hypothetical protein